MTREDVKAEFTSGRVALTDSERESIALALSDALMPYGMDFDPERAARLLEARISVLLAARGERGYREGWELRSGSATPEVLAKVLYDAKRTQYPGMTPWEDVKFFGRPWEQEQRGWAFYLARTLTRAFGGES